MFILAEKDALDTVQINVKTQVSTSFQAVDTGGIRAKRWLARGP